MAFSRGVCGRPPPNPHLMTVTCPGLKGVDYVGNSPIN